MSAGGLVCYWYILLSAALVTCTVTQHGGCDIIITSDGTMQGNFSSPRYPQNYEEDLKCMIKFIGEANERVQINFTDFKLDGFPNELAGVSYGCSHDYIDIYTEIEHPDHDYIEVPIQGRYCGNDMSRLPHLLMSKKQTLIVTFDSNSDGKTARGFFGTYKFISDEPYKMGTPAPFGCGWSISEASKPEGMIMAPYYPAMYPDNQDCFYTLTGRPGQRIKLEFTDFDLYYGGDHCPYDNLVIHDGNSTSGPLIGNYCNHVDGLVIYSTGSSLHLRFITRSGRPRIVYQWGDDVIQMRGFKAKYTFSDKFVNLGFILDGSHIRGTECDVRVKSEGETGGEIISPNFPGASPPNITCFYYIDGLIDQDNLEKVMLTFENVNLPTTGENRCQDSGAYLAVYLYGQKPTADRPDAFLCEHYLPPNLMSSNPRLALRYTTNNITNSVAVGFKAKYQFLMDYAIEGTPATLTSTSDCHFLYMSSSQKAGKLNSPRYPSAYPNDIVCTYELIAQPYEFIMISFDTFNVEQISHGEGDCLGDSFSAVSVIPQSDNNTLQIPMGEYCGQAYPGPLVSEWLTKRMILTFKSDSAVSERGFKAKYEFIQSPERFPCGGNITEGGSGEIVPPNYPLKYQTRTVCDWYIYRHNPLAQIKIKFEHFDIEGTMGEGCQGAVLRIYKADEFKMDHEICGQEAPVDNIVSENGFIRIKFISSSKSFGKTGFKISWTEVMEVDAEKPCPWHQCSDKLLCIPDTAVCNGRDDCLDASDEMDCGGKITHMNLLYIIIAVVIFILITVLVTICLCIRCTGRKPARKRGSASSNRKPSSPSEAHIPHDPEIICHDRLSKTPMLPASQSTGSSTFNPYDHHSDSSNRYSAQFLNHYDPKGYDPTSSHYGYEPQGYDKASSHSGYEPAAPSPYADHHSTLSSKYSYTTPTHQRFTDPVSNSYYSRPSSNNPYNREESLTYGDTERTNYRDTGSCLTSL